MKQVTLNIPEKKYLFFMELIKNLGFVKIQSEQKLYKENQAFVDEVQESLNQVEKHLKGKIELKSADQLFDEL
jgi:hypothetical protein